jgi:hypothetical protein
MNSSCLAHVINLATQLLISTYSKSPHFDPKMPDAHVPTSRDEVGLVRAIVVKVWIMYHGSESSLAYWQLGAFIIKAKRDVESNSKQNIGWSGTSAHTRHESVVVINVPYA